VEVDAVALPDKLWRGYSEPDRVHADAFVGAGRIRLNALAYHRTNEDKVRGDPAEGSARLRVPGDVTTIHLHAQTGQKMGETTEPGLLNFSSESLQATYLFCLSTTQAGATRFGQTLVEVFAPGRFLDSLGAALHALEPGLGPGLEVAVVDALPVRYDKGTIASSAPNHLELVRLPYSQKAPGFATEYEYRIAVVLSGLQEDAPRYLDLVLPDVGTFAKLLGRQGQPG